MRKALIWLLVALLAAPRAATADVISVGAQTGQQIFFSNALTRTYNFGITAAGGSAGLSFDRVDVNIKGGNSASNVQPVVIEILNGLGGTGTVLATGTYPAASLTQQFEFRQVPLNLTLTLPSGGYSLRLTTANTSNYFIKDGQLTLKNPSGTATLSNTVWIQDSNTQGEAGTTIAAVDPVLAQYSLASQTVAFPNFRLGDTLSQTVQLSNSALPTSNNYTQALAGTATTTGTATVSGLPAVGSPLEQAQATNLTVGLGSATAGPVSGTVNLSFTSVQGTSASPGPFGTNVGTPAITVTGTGYRPATAGFSTTTSSLGRFHIGATNVTGTITLDNTQTADQYSEGLAAATTATSGGASVVSGLPTVASPLAAGGQTTVTLGLASVANVGTGNAGTVTLALDTSGTGTSGLAAAGIGSQLINVSAQGYSGQSIWSKASGGVWDDFANWDVPGGLPGVDGSLSVNDTASFGAGPTGATTVNLDGANPVLTQITFNSTDAEYRLAPGSGGAITLGTAQNAATVTGSAGSHAISAGITLARATEFALASSTVLTLDGGLNGGENLTKSGVGLLAINATGNLSGATTVAGGTLRVNGSIGSSAVTIQAGATLVGGGTVGATTIESGGTLSPGNSPGTITANGTSVWQAGGDYNWQIHDAGGTAGSCSPSRRATSTCRASTVPTAMTSTSGRSPRSTRM
jgi:autotransporter-associated beta strand protein